jgi:hypothetical protein
MDLFHCIYCSASAKVELSRKQLDELLAKCRENNARLEITGMLLYQNRSFFQVLEGDQEAVESLYEKIAGDKRHLRVTKIISEPIEQRAFGDWTMGFPKVSSNELAEIPGLNDFFTRGESYMNLGAGRAKTLLDAFKNGRWRAAL